jgi:hypothetical protein
MNNAQEKRQEAQWIVNYQYQELQRLEAGHAGHVCSLPGAASLSLEERRMQADWCLTSVLKALLPTLPKDLRASVQACYDVRERIWSREYLEAYYRAQQEAKSDRVTTAGQAGVSGDGTQPARPV